MASKAMARPGEVAAKLSRSQRKQRSAELRPDLVALRLESQPAPTTVAKLAAAVGSRWRADARGVLQGWDWPQVKAYQRMHQLLRRGGGDG